VAGPPPGHPLLQSDALLAVAEPYANWSIQDDARAPLFRHPAIERVKDVRNCWLRKVRILNGAHTALACKALPMGLETVRQAVEHPEVGPWLRALLDEEIIPTIQERVPDAKSFAHQTLERFANPYLEHQLAAIALNHQAKLNTRLVPTRNEYVAKFHRLPRLLEQTIEAGAGIRVP
jgi:tagaturonate reductase